MKKNLSTLNFSLGFSNKNDNNLYQYETTYKSAFGNFNEENYNNKYIINNNKSIDLKRELLLIK